MKRGFVIIFGFFCLIGAIVWARPFPQTLFHYEERSGMVPESLRHSMQCDIGPSDVTIETIDAYRRSSFVRLLKFTSTIPTIAELKRREKEAQHGPVIEGLAMTDGGLVSYAMIASIDGKGRPTYVSLRSRGEQSVDNGSKETNALVEFIDLNCKQSVVAATQEISEKDAIAIARKTTTMNIAADAPIDIRTDEDTYVVTFKTQLPRHTSGADYHAKVWVNRFTGKVKLALVGS